MTLDELDAIPDDVWDEAMHLGVKAIARLIMENRALKAQLPDQVDPDLLAARKIVADGWRKEGLPESAEEYERGDLDEDYSVQLALAGIKHGREQS